MKRRLFKLCVFILALACGGAIINVAVAWGFAWSTGFDVTANTPEGSGQSLRWMMDRRSGGTRVWFLTGNEPDQNAGDNAVLPNWTEWPVEYPTSEDDDNYWGWAQFQDGFGLPLASMTCTWRTQSSYMSMTSDGLVLSNVPGVPSKERALPVRPLWPGFAINTLFYAAILWLLFAAPGFIRRRIRARRGLCPACAYDLRGSQSKTCPECGTVVRT